MFEQLKSVFGNIAIDLFVFRLNAKRAKYVSRCPEAEAMSIDAFSIAWKHRLMYIFSAFQLNPQSSAKGDTGSKGSSSGSPNVVLPDVVAMLEQHDNRRLFNAAVAAKDPTPRTQTGSRTSFEKTVTGCFSYIRDMLCKQGLMTDSVDLIWKSGLQST